MAAIRLERGRARELRAQADEIDRLVDNLVRLLAVSDSHSDSCDAFVAAVSRSQLQP